MTTTTSRGSVRLSSAVIGFLSCCPPFASSVSTSAQTANAISRNYDLVRSTYYSPADAIEGIRNLAEEKRWQFVRTDAIKREDAEITFVVVCKATVAPAILPVRMPPTVTSPCALISVAERADWSEVSVLHPQSRGKHADSTAQSPSDSERAFFLELLEAVPQ